MKKLNGKKGISKHIDFFASKYIILSTYIIWNKIDFIYFLINISAANSLSLSLFLYDCTSIGLPILFSKRRKNSFYLFDHFVLLFLNVISFFCSFVRSSFFFYFSFWTLCSPLFTVLLTWKMAHTKPFHPK